VRNALTTVRHVRTLQALAHHVTLHQVINITSSLSASTRVHQALQFLMVILDVIYVTLHAIHAKALFLDAQAVFRT
jgi:hypothetical protein